MDAAADALAQAEAEAAENMGVFHPHSPSQSKAIDAEKPPKPEEYELDTTADDKERRASVAAMLTEEAAAAEALGVFHPHEPRGTQREDDSTSTTPRNVREAAPAEEKYIVKPHQAWRADSAEFAKSSLNRPAAAPQEPVKSRGCAIL